jgi:WD40 repeat protein
MLRVWPLDFSDFLLEAHHESGICQLAISNDSAKILVGTSSGTLGMLDVTSRTYKTLLRSHNGSVQGLAMRADGREFGTVGADRTIRIWDTATGHQRVEFSSPNDDACSICFHPTQNVIACGFSSGSVRIFDVPATLALCEHSPHVGTVRSVVYDPIGIRLFSGGDDCQIVLYDATRQYQPVRAIAFDTEGNHIKLALSPDGLYLAVTGTKMCILC